MPRFALPTCPDCHGDGEIEKWFECAAYATVTWEPCPCTFRPVAEEEDWTKP